MKRRFLYTLLLASCCSLASFSAVASGADDSESHGPSVSARASSATASGSAEEAAPLTALYAAAFATPPRTPEEEAFLEAYYASLAAPELEFRIEDLESLKEEGSLTRDGHRWDLHAVKALGTRLDDDQSPAKTKLQNFLEGKKDVKLGKASDSDMDSYEVKGLEERVGCIYCIYDEEDPTQRLIITLSTSLK